MGRTSLLSLDSNEGDWVALYDQDGNLVTYGHSIHWTDIAEILGIPVYCIEIDYDSAGVTGTRDKLTKSELLEFLKLSKEAFAAQNSAYKNEEWYKKRIKYFDDDIHFIKNELPILD